MDNGKKTFWGWVAENPITAVVILLIALGGVAIVVGYNEGFMAIVGGLINWIRGGDSENKQKLEEAKRNTDIQVAAANTLGVKMLEERHTNNMEVLENVENAKAECDELDVVELINIGSDILRDHSAFRHPTTG